MSRNMLRRARIRGLKEGKVQTARVEAFDTNSHDDAERHQDYGFAGNPVDGEGLRIEVGGHTVVIRMDRTAERPHLGAYEVCVWHKEGHKFTLKSGGLIQADCTRFVVNASTEVVLNTPVVKASANVEAIGTVMAAVVNGTTEVIFAGASSTTHRHDLVQPGIGTSGTPV